MCSHFPNYCSKCTVAAPAIIMFLFLPLICSLFFTACSACSNGNCQVPSLSLSLSFPFEEKRSMEIHFELNLIWQILEACSAATDCGPGLFCGNCPALGLKQPICTRGQPTLPTSIVSFFLLLCLKFIENHKFVWSLESVVCTLHAQLANFI